MQAQQVIRKIPRAISALGRGVDVLDSIQQFGALR